jgi:mannose/cellobiose epimerase-like protein (N-acyl-D-glucosamine 2-epimerase family)
VLCKAQVQCLAASQQTVVRVRERKQREEGESHPAPDAATTMNPNPVVMLVVSLLAATAVTHNRISFTERASAYDDLVAVFGPVGCNLARRDGN